MNSNYLIASFCCLGATAINTWRILSGTANLNTAISVILTGMVAFLFGLLLTGKE